MKYVWTILADIIALLVALAVFSVSYSQFEGIVISLLVLTYLSIVSFSSGYSYLKSNELLALDYEFTRIRNLVDQEPEESGSDNERRKENEEKNRVANVKFYINASFYFIIYIIALYNIFKAIGWL